MRSLIKLFRKKSGNKNSGGRWYHTLRNTPKYQILALLFFCILYFVLLIFFYFGDGKITERISTFDTAMPVASTIRLRDHAFNAKQKVKELFKKKLLVLDEKTGSSSNPKDDLKHLTDQKSGLFEYLSSYLSKAGIDLQKQKFEVPGSLYGNLENDHGLNIHFVLEGKRSHGKECFMMTFNYKSGYEVAAITAFLDFYQTNNKPIPFSVLFVGLDPAFKDFGFNINQFLDYFESEEFTDRRCSLVRKGVSLISGETRGKQSIVLSPYGINENIADINTLAPLMNSTSISENSFQANIKLIEENTYYWKSVMKRVNHHLIKPVNSLLSQYLPEFRIQPMTNELLFVSMFKYMYGNPHETHSYLLNRGIRSVSLKLYMAKKPYKMSMYVEDLTKLLYIAYRSHSRNELYMKQGQTQYLFVDETHITQGQYSVFTSYLIQLFPFAFHILFEVLSLGLKSHEAFINSTSRCFFLVVTLFLTSQLPYYIDKLMQNHNLKYGVLCTYKPSLFNQGINTLVVFMTCCLVFFYTIGKSFEKSVYKIKNEASKIDRKKADIFVAKLFILTMSVYFGISDLGMSFFSAIFLTLLFIPVNRLYGLKFICFIVFGGLVTLFFYNLNPYNVLISIKKSVRAQACLGDSKFFTFSWFFSGLILNYLYVHLKYMLSR